MLGSVDHAHLTSLIRAVAASDAAGILEIVAELSAQARDLEAVLTGIAEVVHRVALVQCAPGYRDPERSDWDSVTELADLISPEDAQLYYQIAVQGGRDLGIAPDPRTGLEMALLRMLAFRPAHSGLESGSAPAVATTKKRAGVSTGTAATATAKPTPAPAQPVSSQRQPAGEPVPDPVGEGTAEQGSFLESVAVGNEWYGLLAQLDLEGPVKELARNIQLESRSGARWRFLIPDTVRHLGSESVIQKLQSALTSQLGHPVDLALHTATQAVTTPAVVHENATRERLSEAERAIEKDPTVRELKERMDARIVEDSVQPLQ